MEKKKICISVENFVYEELKEQAHERGFGSGKYSLSAFIHYVLINRIRQYEWSKKDLINHDGKGAVYIIQMGNDGPVKIGFSNRLSERLKSIQTDCPYKIKIIAVIENCSFQDEHDLHKKYRHLRIHGEWFEKNVLSLINEDIKALQTKHGARLDLPTSSDHYLYLMEA
jgi:hypothetical protein